MSRFRLVKSYPWLGRLFRPWLVSNAYEALAFVKTHRRLPRFAATGFYNDLLFRLRAQESDYVFRAFTSDKEFSKIFVRGVTGQDLSVPTLAVLRSAEAVPGFDFPDNCVIKPTHMSGEVIFHKTGDPGPEARRKMQRWFTLNFGDMTGERHYQRLSPKIIVEPWLALNGAYCNDYRFFLYRGQVRVIELKLRSSETVAFPLQFLPDWTLFPGHSHYTDPARIPDQQSLEALRPGCFETMRSVSEALGADIEHLRVDFFCDGNSEFYVGEISHINSNAREIFLPVESERLFVKGAS